MSVVHLPFGLLEPEAVRLTARHVDQVALSQAISLKRIADNLEEIAKTQGTALMMKTERQG